MQNAKYIFKTAPPCKHCNQYKHLPSIYLRKRPYLSVVHAVKSVICYVWHGFVYKSICCTVQGNYSAIKTIAFLLISVDHLLAGSFSTDCLYRWTHRMLFDFLIWVSLGSGVMCYCHMPCFSSLVLMNWSYFLSV